MCQVNLFSYHAEPRYKIILFSAAVVNPLVGGLRTPLKSPYHSTLYIIFQKPCATLCIFSSHTQAPSSLVPTNLNCIFYTLW